MYCIMKNFQLHLNLKPRLNCSYLVPNFGANWSIVLIKLLFLKTVYVVFNNKKLQL